MKWKSSKTKCPAEVVPPCGDRKSDYMYFDLRHHIAFVMTEKLSRAKCRLHQSSRKADFC